MVRCSAVLMCPLKRYTGSKHRNPGLNKNRAGFVRCQSLCLCPPVPRLCASAYMRQCVLFVVTPSVNQAGVDVISKTVVNTTQIFDCPVTGVPAPRVVWLTDGRPIEPRHGSNVEVRNAGRQLVIRSVALADSGTYRCVATNRAGQDFVDFTLHVHGILDLLLYL